VESSRIGCLPVSGILAALLVILVVVLVSIFQGGVLFNPGELSAQSGTKALGGVFSHADIPRCASCHAPFWSDQHMDERCLDCHTDLLTDPHGFHRVMIAQGAASTCRDCHTDHNGPSAPLTVLDLTTFPHDNIGFSLLAHQTTVAGTGFICSDCHKEGFTSFDQVVCDRCHLEIDAIFVEDHIQTFGQDCLACHDGADTYGSEFDHDWTAFPLQGKHAELECSACHPGARSRDDLQAASLDCFACHAQDDAHSGSFGESCGGCHDTTSWEGAEFDHSQAAFPLTGAHLVVPCEECHIEDVFVGTPGECVACHTQDDAHSGAFGESCGECHNTANWGEALFDHSQATFPLTGAHLGLPCQSCHLEDVFVGTAGECSACHVDPSYHLGLFSGTCDHCHSTLAWRPASFDQSHTFPINHGESGMSPCQSCHPDSLSTYTCFVCHEHSPVGIENEHREEGISDFQDCVRCHPTGREDEYEGEDD
jgi:hypothetical protein